MPDELLVVSTTETLILSSTTVEVVEVIVAPDLLEVAVPGEVVIVSATESLVFLSEAAEVVEVAGAFNLLEVAMQGPVGPTGPSGMGGSSGTAGEALGGNRAVVGDAVNTFRYASNANPQHLGRLAGITTGAANLGGPVALLSSGPMTEPSWAWTPNLPVFLSTNGLLTQTPPVAGFLQVVGLAITATALFVNPREPLAIL